MVCAKSHTDAFSTFYCGHLSLCGSAEQFMLLIGTNEKSKPEHQIRGGIEDKSKVFFFLFLNENSPASPVIWMRL